MTHPIDPNSPIDHLAGLKSAAAEFHPVLWSPSTSPRDRARKLALLLRDKAQEHLRLARDLQETEPQTSLHESGKASGLLTAATLVYDLAVNL